jgi:type IV secretory pathway VirB10-like protein
MDTDERAALYVQFLEQAAKEYRCATTDMPAKMAASRRLSFEVYTAQLIDGRNPDPATLRWFLEEEARYAPPPEPLRVTIEVVGKDGVPISELPREPDPTPPSPPTPPNPPAETKPPLPAVVASNVVELPRRGGSIHDACPLTGPMPPLKRLQPELPNLGTYDGGSNPFSAGPMPNFGAHHPLPSPHDRDRS